MDNEKKKDYEENLRIGRAVSSFANSNGWQEIVKPALEGKRELYLQELKTAGKIEDFYRIKYGIQGIDGLFNLINFCITQGKDAAGKLEKEDL